MPINYPFTLSCVDSLAGFHFPSDPYFPNQRDDGWLEPALEDNHEIPLDDGFAEPFREETDSEPEVKNLPQVAPIPNPNPRPEFEGPTPMWVGSLDRWSHEQGQPHPYNGDRRFYNLNERGSADRALPIIVRVARNVELNVAAIQ